MSSEVAMKRAEAYLKQKEYLCAAYYQFLEEKGSKDKFDNVRKPMAKVSKSDSNKGGCLGYFLAMTLVGAFGLAEDFSAEGVAVFFVFIMLAAPVLLIIQTTKK